MLQSQGQARRQADCVRGQKPGQQTGEDLLTVAPFIHVADPISVLPCTLGHSEATCRFRGNTPCVMASSLQGLPLCISLTPAQPPRSARDGRELEGERCGPCPGLAELRAVFQGPLEVPCSRMPLLLVFLPFCLCPPHSSLLPGLTSQRNYLAPNPSLGVGFGMSPGPGSTDPR